MDNSLSIVVLDQLIYNALSRHASDIHFEPMAQGIRVRYRCDGVLEDMLCILPVLASRILARIKVLSHLDISEKRIPQDGKFLFAAPHGEIDMRVSTFPTQFGEKIVIRILDQISGMRTLHTIGFSQHTLNIMVPLMNRPQGLFMVTGPTGSGKTTTLYSILSYLNVSQKNIITLEDPIEYTISGITQAHVRADIGFGFAEGLRALLRQDPDIIMVGEIRDTETVQASVRAALTGHLVLSTLHTTSAIAAITRLLDMKVEPFLLSSVVAGVLAQRLVRKICEHCRIEDQDTSLLQYLFHDIPECIYRGRGCYRCYGTGYYGRTVIGELLVFSEQLRAAIARHASYDELEVIAREHGMQTMSDDARTKIIMGVTTVSEVMRVI